MSKYIGVYIQQNKAYKIPEANSDPTNHFKKIVS